MDADSAAECLQVIRTLKERSAIYRRALAPIMIFLGILGMVARLMRCFNGATSSRTWIGIYGGADIGWDPGASMGPHPHGHG